VYLGLVGFSLGLNMGHFRTRRTAPSCGEDNDLLAEILPRAPPGTVAPSQRLPRLQALASPRHRPPLLLGFLSKGCLGLSFIPTLDPP
jgi:hypothetical protein